MSAITMLAKATTIFVPMAGTADLEVVPSIELEIIFVENERFSHVSG